MDITLYGMTGSGNCWKPKALLDLLSQPYQWQEVNLLAGGSRTPEFLALNPNGKVPLMTVDGRPLAESNAMLVYLAEGTPWLPADAFTRAQVLSWMFFEQYSHEPYIATVRFWVAYMGKQQEWTGKIAEAMPKGCAALGVMEQQLSKTPYLVGSAPTVADIALYAYTHVADQGGYDLGRYPALLRWMHALESLPGFVSMRAACPPPPYAPSTA